MGRGRVQLRPIENNISRQVTFSKRRTGLLKKAHEISVLCDAEVALIVFSNKGKLFEYSSDSSMERTLERYERKSYAERQLLPTESESQANWSLECPKLMSTIEALQRNLRHFLGEELDPLSLRDLQLLEQQLDNSLKRIRTRKNKLMHESISELQKKEKTLQDQNNMLTKKLKEKEKTSTEHAQFGQQNLAQNSPLSIQPPPQPSTIQFPSLTIGGSYQAIEGSFFWNVLGRLELKEQQSLFENPNNGVKELNEELEKYSANISGVPNYTINGKHQLSGGQPPEAFMRAFQVAAK